MATFQNLGRANLTPEQVRMLEPLFQSIQQGTGDSMSHTQERDPYAYAQQSPDFQSMALYDPQGNYLGDDARNHESGDKNLMRFLLTAAAMYGGGQLLGGEAGALGGGGDALAGAEGMGVGGGGVEAGVAAGGGSSVQPLSMFDMGINAVPGAPAMTGGLQTSLASMGLSQIPQVGGMEALGSAAAKAALENYSNEGRNYPTTQSTQGAGGSPWNAAVHAASGMPWKNILGAALGAYSSRDRDSTQTRAPWEPAQPLLKGLLSQGETLAQGIGQQTPGQKTAYGNLGSLINSLNTGAPGLLAGLQANATGANNYDRANPRRPLMGGQFDLSQFMPGLFGGK